jgi:hypothetical protein
MFLTEIFIVFGRISVDESGSKKAAAAVKKVVSQ